LERADRDLLIQIAEQTKCLPELAKTVQGHEVALEAVRGNHEVLKKEYHGDRAWMRRLMGGAWVGLIGLAGAFLRRG
jgi:hypothetical protein